VKSRDLFEGIFILALRLLGLVFLYLGLSAVPALLDFGALATANKSDLVSALLPIAFNLAIAWWLLGSRALVRRAYPPVSKMSREFHAPGQEMDAPAEPGPGPATELSAVDTKLASLLRQPKDEDAA
jgi:hypothetical protein